LRAAARPNARTADVSAVHAGQANRPSARPSAGR
jgi:hypothetical protein